MNTYKFTLTERNGEQEYSYDYLVYAKDQKQAETIADDFAAQWYADLDVEYNTENDSYEFFGGCIVATISDCSEYSIVEFSEELLRRFSIGAPE